MGFEEHIYVTTSVPAIKVFIIDIPIAISLGKKALDNVILLTYNYPFLPTNHFTNTQSNRNQWKHDQKSNWI